MPLRSVDDRFTVAGESRHGEGHGNAGDRRRNRVGGAELLAAGTTMPSGNSRLDAHAAQVVDHRADAVGFLHAQLGGVSHHEPVLGVRAEHRQHRNLVDQRRREAFVDRAAAQFGMLDQQIAHQLAVAAFEIEDANAGSHPDQKIEQRRARGIGPTPRMLRLDPGASSAATMKKAAEDKSEALPTGAPSGSAAQPR